MKITSVSLFGAGAVGSYFVWGFSHKPEIDFCVIASGERKSRLEKDGLIINGEHYFPTVRTPKEAKGADLMIVSTKYDGLLAGLDEIEAATGEQTVIMSVMNGVDSEELIGERVGMEHMLFSLIKIASRRNGGTVTFDPEKVWGIVYGEASYRRTDAVNNAFDTESSSDSMAQQMYPSERMQAVAEAFDGTGMHAYMSDHILKEIWEKFAFNVSFNLPQAILNCGIGAYNDSVHADWLRMRLRGEVATIAAAKGIDIMELSDLERTKHPSPPAARYSTLQDLDENRHTEIDMFAGAVVRMGDELAIPTPYNAFAYHAIKALEEKNDGKFEYE